MDQRGQADLSREFAGLAASLKAQLGLLQQLGGSSVAVRLPDSRLPDGPREASPPSASSADGPSRLERLRCLEAEASGCTSCRLAEGRTKVVYGVGSPVAELMFIGEGPGRDEDLQGIPFVGKAGQLLTRIIEAMGLRREDVYIANVVKCRPPQNRKPHLEEVLACRPWLKGQLEIVKPRVICVLGQSAGVGLGLMEPTDSVGRFRGRFHDFHGVPCMVTYHPAYLLRNPAEKRKVWSDVQQIIPLLSGGGSGASTQAGG